MELSDILGMTEGANEPGIRCVVRVRTSAWSDERGLYTKRSITYLRKSSIGENWLKKEVGALGAEDVIGGIVNFDAIEDGLYEIVLANVLRDWETGIVDDYEYELRPFEGSE